MFCSIAKSCRCFKRSGVKATTSTVAGAAESPVVSWEIVMPGSLA
jgi:hypothetical protein